jgi:hypothetical protein
MSARGRVAGVTAVNVAIESVKAKVDGRWVSLSSTAMMVDLMQAKDSPVTLADGAIPSGHYTEVRLMVSSVEVVDARGSHLAHAPSAGQSGLKVEACFRVSEGQNGLTLALIWDLSKSLVKQGNGRYLLKPHLRARLGSEEPPPAVSSAVVGFTTNGSVPLGGVRITAIYISGGALSSGAVAATLYTEADGTFKFEGLPDGTYDFQFSWAEPGGRVLTASLGVAVASGFVTDLGEVVLF